MFKILLVPIIFISFISSDVECHSFFELSNLATESIGKYKVGDVVKCSQWQNDSHWKGRVTKVVNNVIYQVEISDVKVYGATKLSLNPSECTGKKRLSYEDGEEYNKTSIWVHERCLD